MKTLHFFSHWTFREGLQALRCEKRCKVFLEGVRGWGLLEDGIIDVFEWCLSIVLYLFPI